PLNEQNERRRQPSKPTPLNGALHRTGLSVIRDHSLGRWLEPFAFSTPSGVGSMNSSSSGIRPDGAVAATMSTNLFDSLFRCIEPSDQNERRSEEHTSELQSHSDIVCRLL